MFLECLYVKKEQNAVTAERALHLMCTCPKARKLQGCGAPAVLHNLLFLPVDACQCYCIVQSSCGPGCVACVYVKLWLLEKFATVRGLLQAVPWCRASASFHQGELQQHSPCRSKANPHLTKKPSGALNHSPFRWVRHLSGPDWICLWNKTGLFL